MNPNQLSLYCAPSGDDYRHITPIVPANRDDLMNKHFELNNKKAFRLTNYTIFYNILPFPVIDEDGFDMRHNRQGNYRFLNILITDARLRFWRNKFLENKNQSNDGEENDGNDMKKRKTNENVHAVCGTDITDQYNWPTQLVENIIDDEYMISDKVFQISFIILFDLIPYCFLYFILLDYLHSISAKTNF